jgi:hypothetical protein
MRRLPAALLGVTLAATAPAAEPKLPADLLEFLGSVDGEDDPDWQDYLAATDVAKLPKAPVADKTSTDKSKVPSKAAK